MLDGTVSTRWSVGTWGQLGQAVAAYAIAFGGYVGGAAAQDQSALDAIRYASGFIPVLFILLMC